MLQNLVAKINQDGASRWAATDDVSMYNNVAKIDMHTRPTWAAAEDVSMYDRQNTRLQNLLALRPTWVPAEYGTMI
jgi:hypothetical protein